MSIRSQFKRISDKYDESLVEEGQLWKKNDNSSLDKRGVDAFDHEGKRVDTKYPESVKNFYFQASKMLDDKYTLTEDYWYVFHGTIYKYHREDLKAFVSAHKDKWTEQRFSDGYSEERLYLESVGGDPRVAAPYEEAPLSEKTAILIEGDIMKKNRFKPITIDDNSRNWWTRFRETGAFYRQNYCCMDNQKCSDGCYRFQQYEFKNGEYVPVSGAYYKASAEDVDRFKFNNKGYTVISRENVKKIGVKCHA